MGVVDIAAVASWLASNHAGRRRMLPLPIALRRSRYIVVCGLFAGRFVDAYWQFNNLDTHRAKHRDDETGEINEVMTSHALQFALDMH